VKSRRSVRQARQRFFSLNSSFGEFEFSVSFRTRRRREGGPRRIRHIGKQIELGASIRAEPGDRAVFKPQQRTGFLLASPGGSAAADGKFAVADSVSRAH
jgi:hypothetical protein